MMTCKTQNRVKRVLVALVAASMMLGCGLMVTAQQPLWDNVMDETEQLAAAGQYATAITRLVAIDSVLVARGDTATSDRGALLNRLASYHAMLGQYDEARQQGEQALRILKHNAGSDHHATIVALGNLATYHYHLGNYGEAVRLGNEVLQAYRQCEHHAVADRATALNNLAGYYAKLGNYAKAVTLGEEALAAYGQAPGGKNGNSYASAMSKLASYHAAQGDLDAAIQLGTQALEMRRQLVGDSSMAYATTLSNLSSYYAGKGDYGQAIGLCGAAAQIYRTLLGDRHPFYATTLMNLSSYHSLTGNGDEAIWQQQQAVDIYREVLGEHHPQCAIALNKLARLHAQQGNTARSAELAAQAMAITRDHMLATFAGLNTWDRASYWGIRQHEFTTFYPSILFATGDPSWAGVAYNNCALFAKGLLLNTETQMRQLIQESGDDEALAAYKAYCDNQEMLTRQQSRPIASRQVDCDSLRAVIDHQGRELARMSAAFGDYTRNLRLTWQDVQHTLGDDDIAIEFLAFPTAGDSLTYVALTLRKGDTLPHMVTVCEQRQLPTGDIRASSADSTMTSVVWEPMHEQLDGVKNIYFSPAGDLHSLAIEYLPGMERYNLYRLSSTRELVTGVSRGATGGEAALFGDINYNTDIQTLVEQATSGQRLRGGTTRLPSTRHEVEAIHELMPDAALYMDNSATEETFKALSGKRTSIIHLATHGFYFTPDDAKRNSDMAFLGIVNDEAAPSEDKSLTRSGLLMAGANNVLEGEALPQGVEDGVLTAKEIAQLDLRGCELTVLSACRTALGDITSGEGVFGLQRGFKKAGVRSLLMSLWKVDDEATQILMTEFYRQLVAGHGKRAAFRAAQQHLRTVDNGKWNSPQHWAAFILLDALE